MDENKLRKGIQGLKWEAKYKQRDSDSSASSYFLAPTNALDPDFDRYLKTLGLEGCSVLDVGTGTGEQAVLLAQKGYTVTAIDVSASAIETARLLNEQNGTSVSFKEDNILLSSLNEIYDLITDRGCFTVIPPAYYPEYLNAIKKILKKGGWLLLKADKKKNEYLDLFAAGGEFEIRLREQSIYTALNNKEIPAVFMAIQKVM